MAEQVELPAAMHKTNASQSAVRLTGRTHASVATMAVSDVLLSLELGPRMNLSLLKIEDGLAEGKVLYHSVRKTLLLPWAVHVS
jgi:hypothetical protein